MSEQTSGNSVVTREITKEELAYVNQVMNITKMFNKGFAVFFYGLIPIVLIVLIYTYIKVDVAEVKSFAAVGLVATLISAAGGWFIISRSNKKAAATYKADLANPVVHVASGQMAVSAASNTSQLMNYETGASIQGPFIYHVAKVEFFANNTNEQKIAIGLANQEVLVEYVMVDKRPIAISIMDSAGKTNNLAN